MGSIKSPVAVNVMMMTEVMMVVTMSLFVCASSLCFKHLFLFLPLNPNSYGSHSLGSLPLVHEVVLLCAPRVILIIAHSSHCTFTAHNRLLVFIE